MPCFLLNPLPAKALTLLRWFPDLAPVEREKKHEIKKKKLTISEIRPENSVSEKQPLISKEHGWVENGV